MVFGTDGIRGFVNKYPMLPELLVRIGLILPKIIGPKLIQNVSDNTGINPKDRPKVLIAKDTRLSGYMIEPALVSGLIAAGADVILIGPMPTNAVSMLIPSLRCDFGIMITASHNPYYDNGLKIFDCNGKKICNTIEEQINSALLSLEQCEKISDNEYYKENLCTMSSLGKAIRLEDVHGRYVEHIKASFPKQYSLNGLRIVIDCANGASYKIAPMILWELGAEVITLGCEPNGSNINDNCGSVHPAAMCEKVIETRADIGIALDGDGDRIVICDEYGTLIDGNHLIGALLHYFLLSNQLKRKVIVVTEVVNSALVEYAKKFEVEVIQTSVGDRHIMRELEKHGLVFGAEPSGHIMLKNYTNSSDGIVAGLQVLAAKIYSGASISEIAKPFELYPAKSFSIPFTNKNPLNEDMLKKIDELRIMHPDAKIVVRKSGTESVIRVVLETREEILLEQLEAEILSLF